MGIRNSNWMKNIQHPYFDLNFKLRHLYFGFHLIFITCLSLSEVGKLEAPKLGSNYDTGQLFLHKVSKITFFNIIF